MKTQDWIELGYTLEQAQANVIKMANGEYITIEYNKPKWTMELLQD